MKQTMQAVKAAGAGIFSGLLKMVICSFLYDLYSGNKKEKYMNFMAERKGFEPSMSCPIHEFQSCAFDHSATSLSLSS